MYILIAGGAGFIGTHLINELSGRNHSIVVMDNGLSSDIKYLEKFDVNRWENDIRNDNSVKKLLMSDLM